MSIQSMIDDDTLAALQGQLTGELARPSDAGYELASPFNLAVTVKPRVVVAAADAGDVAATVSFAAEHGLRVLAQRTGHGAIPLDGVDGADSDVILLHTGALNSIAVDVASITATVGAGALWGEVVAGAAAHGLAALGGSSPTVGVAGLLTGSGIGPLNRTFGVASDHVRSFEVVTGDGEIRRVSAEENPDLFWGLRGGRGTLGIVTAAEIELAPMSRFWGGAVFFDGSDAETVLQAWREWGATLPEHASTSLAIMNLPPIEQIPPPIAGKVSVAVRFASVAYPEEAERVFAPMLAAATPIFGGVAETPYSEIGTVHNDPPDPAPGADTSLLLREFTAETAQALLAVAGPDSGSPLTAVELRLLGGAMARPGPHESAFDHRSAAVNLFAVGMLAPPIADAVHDQLEKVAEALEPWATGGVLPTFAAAGTDPSRVYDEVTVQRLATLGDEYDPSGVFRVGRVTRTPR